MTETSSPGFFEAKYKADPDPWRFATNDYELGRYSTVISAISGGRYRHAFEPGCSIGLLTQLLAEHCELVYAIDFSPSAAMQAAHRCAHLSNVKVYCASILDPLPANEFDLLVLSEIGYYFSNDEWQRISGQLVDPLPLGATVLAAHWLGSSQDHCISGDEVHEVLRGHPALRLDHSERHDLMRLDRFEKL